MAPDHRDGYWRSADGLRLHFRDYPGDPAKAPLLCVPGLTRNARDFEGVAARLAGTRRILCVDLRGRGQSDHAVDPMQYVPPVYLADLHALLEAEGLARVVWFGTSLGGLLAMLLAIGARDRLAGVLLNDVGPVLGAAGMARIRAYVGREAAFAGWDEAADAIAANHAGTFPDYDRVDWLRWAHRMCRADGGTIRFDYDPRIAEPFRHAAGAAPVDLWPAFDSLAGVPTLLVRGEHSDVLEPATATAMARRMPALECVTIPRVGHAPTLEEPEAAAAIDRLLARVDHE